MQIILRNKRERKIINIIRETANHVDTLGVWRKATCHCR